MLLLMLGAVTMLMRQLQRPETEEFLGRVFAEPHAKDPTNLKSSEQGVQAAGKATPATRPYDASEFREGPWAAVTDNAIFSSAEREAWSLLIKQAAEAAPAELAQRSLGEVAYAQLVSQPQAYRGQPVRIRGTAVRVEAKPAPSNPLGLAEYHQVWIAPRGGGQWPLVAYVLQLPEKFPRGDGLRERVSIDGFFFKNWSYPHPDGMGLAPVLVARSISWNPPPAATDLRRPLNVRDLLLGAAVAVAAAMGFVFWIVRHTRRGTSRRNHLPETIALENQP